MSIFGTIMSSIFGRASSAGTAPTPPAPGLPKGRWPTSVPVAPPAPGAKPPSATPAYAPAGAVTQVDVAFILTKLASEKRDKLDWRKSIVDLMKLLDLDSSLSARKELAQELYYSGDINDLASMNVWLHKEVMRKLAENGGKVPDELKA